MSWAAAVVLMVAIMAIAGVMRSRHNASIGYATDEDGKPVGNPQRERELEAELAQLRKRLEVLERIATDANSSEWREGKRLSAEIEDLRTRD